MTNSGPNNDVSDATVEQNVFVEWDNVFDPRRTESSYVNIALNIE